MSAKQPTEGGKKSPDSEVVVPVCFKCKKLAFQCECGAGDLKK